MTRLSLERLCERIVSEHDYDLAVLAQWDGRRRYANMRKLARLARSYEELRGPDVEGFVRFVNEQEAVGARELEAVAEEEGGDAVRLLTIHAAKGLEFKVVIVADAGRDKAPPSPDEILALSDGRFGFRVADPVTTKRRGAFDYDDVREARRARGGGREAAPLLRRDDAREGAADRLRRRSTASKKADASTPIGWVLGRLDADEELDAAGDGAGRDRAQRARGSSSASTATAPRLDGAPRSSEPSRTTRRSSRSSRASRRSRRSSAAPVLPPLVAPAEPPLHRAAPALVHRALDLRAVLVPLLRALRRRHAGAAGPSATRRRRPARDGDRRRRAPAARAGRPRRAGAARISSRSRVWYPTVSDEELERIRAFVASYCDSELARRVAALDGVAEGAALHVRARRRAAARLRRRRCTSTARARSSSTTRRT